MNNVWFGYEDENYKHKSKKKSIKKADHKHQYELCYIDYCGLHEGEYCSICGRIKTYSLCKIQKPNKNLPIFKISSFFDKYVSLQN